MKESILESLSIDCLKAGRRIVCGNPKYLPIASKGLKEELTFWIQPMMLF